jgi:hypothetical protein
MASIITATTTSGLTQSADNSGVLQLASGVGNLVTVPAVTGTAMVSGNMPAFSAYAGSATSLSGGGFTKVIHNTENFDTAGCFNNTGSTVTLNGISVPSYSFAPNVAGYYQVNANAYIEGTPNNSVIAIFKNNSGFSYGSGIGGTAQPYYQAATLVYLNGTSDYIHVALYTGTSSLTTGFGTNYTFSASLVRGA